MTRLGSLLTQVVAALSRRTPAFQPAPGQPTTFGGALALVLRPRHHSTAPAPPPPPHRQPPADDPSTRPPHNSDRTSTADPSQANPTALNLSGTDRSRAHMGSAAVHRSFVVVDVESYGDPTRTSPHRTATREGMYQVLMTAFADCGLPWDDKSVDDVGDSLMVLLPAEVPKAALVDQLPERVVAALREHNHVHADGARLRMRMAVHAGEVHYDEHGKTSAEMIFMYRILDAAEAKRALRDSTATLVLIASDPFYQAVIHHRPATRPDDYRPVDVAVKEVRARAWVRLVDGHPVESAHPTGRPRSLTELGPLIEVMLRTPGFDTREGRDLVLRELPFAAAIPRHNADRPDVISIVRTCAHYPGGLEALLESIRFYAAGATEIAELDTLLAQRTGGVQ